MLDSIRRLSDVPPSGDARVAREDLIAARQRRALQQQAQQRAQACIRQAQAEAEAIRAQAFREGYADGMVRAAHDLANSLITAQTLGAHLREDLARAARELLREVLERGEWLDDILERWLAQQPGTGGRLQVLLPLRCKPQGLALRAQLQELWAGELTFDYQAEERYVFRLAEQLLEFDIGAACQRLEPLLLARLGNLPESVRCLDATAIELLRDLCAGLGVQAAAGVRHED